MMLIAVVCAAVSAALMFPASTTAPRPVPDRPDQRAQRGVSRSGWLVLAAAVATAPFVGDGSLLALVLVLLASAAGALGLIAAARRRKLAELRQGLVLEVCEALAGELRSGQPPVRSIEHCVEVWAEFETVATAARLGADVPTALRQLGETPGASDLREVAAAWAVSQRAGGGLADALGQVASSARAAAGTRRLIASELASAQATARLVAALPVVTLVMGSGIGGDPWGFLLETPLGLSCLAMGLALAFLGLVWIDRIAWAVTRS